MKILLITILTLLTGLASAQGVKVTHLSHVGPYKLMNPVMIDSVDASQKKFTTDGILNTHLSLDAIKNANYTAASNLPTNSDTTIHELYLAGFTFNTTTFTSAEISVKGPKLWKAYVNGKEVNGKEQYQPGDYQVVIKYVADTAKLNVELVGDSSKLAIVTPENRSKRAFNLMDNMLMRHYAGVEVSPSGKYAYVRKTWFNPDGSSHYEGTLIEATTEKVCGDIEDFEQWMPQSDKYLYTKDVDGKHQLWCGDPQTKVQSLLCAEMPNESYMMSPTEDFLILMSKTDGPSRETGVYEILTPDDRQPGWRTRYQISKMDLASGLVQPLTYGNKNVWPSSISEDGKYLIFSFSTSHLTQRPTSRQTVCKMNLETLQIDTLVKADGFITGGGDWIPGTNKLLISGSPESFNGIGLNLPQGMTPNEFDYQLYLLDIESKEVTPLTKNFNPAIKNVLVQRNGMIYFTAENADSVSLYKLDTKNWNITKINQPCEVIVGASLSQNGSTLVYYGSGACTSERLYVMTTKKNEVKELEDLNADRMTQLEIGTCTGFSFQSKNGYPISGHYYLPAHFDASKKYPVIVHYYGGCSPTSRRFGGGSHYPAHYWNALGYIVLVVNPSGATGFGQEWGARHVNTMGEGVAEDIIETTEWFAQNSWVNKDKIGCVSASYGGFMTQLLLTKTDLFATGISHAGISDHTSYWGEGYWGYSYSEVCAANSYPWTRKDLFVDRSPLFNADKIHKPLLFTHGTADTNVPIGESIQMYTALKLLGIPTAFIMVEGENHGIMNFDKRIKWINSMMAWFQKWLQDDDSWWNAMYSPKDL